MASEHDRPASGRAERVEAKLRSRAEQIRPREQLTPHPTALGLCHGCAEIVYAGDSLAMAGIYLFHDECASRADSANAT